MYTKEEIEEMNKGKCSPHRTDDIISCFTHDELIKIAKSYNSFTKVCSQDKKKGCYPVKRIADIHNKSKEDLYRSLESRFKKLCPDESCWVTLDFINKIPDSQFVHNLKHFTFKPKMTGNRWKWLSTMDINFVLQQYQLVDPTFRFLGAQPSDFLDLEPQGSLFIDKKELINSGIKHLGLVLNLDPHDAPGSHWVAVYIEDLRSLDYFDSTGDNFTKLPRIKRTVSKLCKILDIPKDKIKINDQVHQTGDTECGVYSIYFIIQRVLGNDFKTVTQSIIKDNVMNLFRNVIFI